MRGKRLRGKGVAKWPEPLSTARHTLLTGSAEVSSSLIDQNCRNGTLEGTSVCSGRNAIVSGILNTPGDNAYQWKIIENCSTEQELVLIGLY